MTFNDDEVQSKTEILMSNRSRKNDLQRLGMQNLASISTGQKTEHGA
jgi:hypothetical protein